MVMAMQEAHFVSWGPPSAQDMEPVWLQRFMRSQKKQIIHLFSKSLCIKMRISSLTRTLHSKRNVFDTFISLKQDKRYRIRWRNASDDIHSIHLHSFELTSLAGKPTAGILKGAKEKRESGNVPDGR